MDINFTETLKKVAGELGCSCEEHGNAWIIDEVDVRLETNCFNEEKLHFKVGGYGHHDSKLARIFIKKIKSIEDLEIKIASKLVHLRAWNSSYRQTMLIKRGRREAIKDDVLAIIDGNELGMLAMEAGLQPSCISYTTQRDGMYRIELPIAKMVKVLKFLKEDK